MSRVFCIYPDDQSTRFLNRIQNHLKLLLGSSFHCYKVKPDQESHDNCLTSLRTDGTQEFVIFLGHGRSDRLYGANTHSDVFQSSYFEYENDDFINRANIDVFRDKKVFCLSCNSADGIAKYAYQAGAKAFIGFGDIPSDDERIPELGARAPVLVARFKGEIIWIVKTSIAYSITHRLSVLELFDIVRLLTNARINDIIITHLGLRHRRLLADYLYDFKQNMKLFGNPNERILD